MADPDASIELLTARGAGGVAVVSMRGARRHAACAALLRRPDGRAVGPDELAGRGPWRLDLELGGRVIDQVLFVDRCGIERSELHLHGSPAILEALDAAVGPLVRPTRSAAERLLEHAIAQAQLALALEQLRGPTWPEFLDRLRRSDPRDRSERIAAARRRSRVARALAEPGQCVLVGRQNAGKSTLLNRLTFAASALAGPRAGLTRDPVRETVTLSGYPYRLVDTAGEGPVDDPLDALAQERGRRERGGALELLVCDGSQPFGDLERSLLGPGTVVVRSKSDLLADRSWPDLPAPTVVLSCADPARAPEVRCRIGEALRSIRRLPPAPERGVGGPAALDAGQQALLDQLADGAPRGDGM